MFPNYLWIYRQCKGKINAFYFLWNFTKPHNLSAVIQMLLFSLRKEKTFRTYDKPFVIKSKTTTVCLCNQKYFTTNMEKKLARVSSARMSEHNNRIASGRSLRILCVFRCENYVKLKLRNDSHSFNLISQQTAITPSNQPCTITKKIARKNKNSITQNLAIETEKKVGIIIWNENYLKTKRNFRKNTDHWMQRHVDQNTKLMIDCE